MSSKKINTVSTYSMEDTGNDNLKRYVDRNGDWTHYWLVREKRFVKAVNHVLSLGYSKGPQFRIYLETHTQEQIAKTLSERGDEGARTHAAIRDLIRGVAVDMDRTKYATDLGKKHMETLNYEEWRNLMAFDAWRIRYQPQVVAFEDSVTDGEVAGTFDALMVITVPSGDKVFEKPFWGREVLILLDWKSSSSVWSEYEAQTAIYWKMIKADPKFAKLIAQYAKAYAGRIFSGVVRLGSQHASGYQFIYFDQRHTEGEHLRRFDAAKVIADRHEPEFNPNVEELPTRLSMKIPKAKVPAAPKQKRAIKKIVTKKLPI